MHVLHRQGTPVAVGYMLTAKVRAYDYITGFDPDLAALGLGTVLIGCAIEAAVEEGARGSTSCAAARITNIVGVRGIGPPSPVVCDR